MDVLLISSITVVFLIVLQSPALSPWHLIGFYFMLTNVNNTFS